MKTALVQTTLIAAVLFLGGCTLLEDNSTHLAYALERGAKKLRASSATEYIVHYEPLGGIHQSYEITFYHSREVVRMDKLGNILNIGGSELVVTGREHVGTSYHERFVFTPRNLHISKSDAATEVILRKVGDRIDVVALR